MCRELQEFSLLIDERFDLTEKRTNKFWAFLISLFK